MGKETNRRVRDVRGVRLQLRKQQGARRIVGGLRLLGTAAPSPRPCEADSWTAVDDELVMQVRPVDSPVDPT